VVVIEGGLVCFVDSAVGAAVGLFVTISDGDMEGCMVEGLCDGIAVGGPGAGAIRNTMSSTSEYGSPC